MQLFQKALDLIAGNHPFAFAVVVRATGSTPQKAGAKAIFEPGGAIYGTLGGGCLEAESQRRALLALDEGQPALFELSLDDDYGWDDGLICGGRVTVFVEPRSARLRDAFCAAVSSLSENRGGVLRFHLKDDRSAVWLSEPAGENDASVYDEVVEPQPTLLIAGGGHVGQATARLGVWLGFQVVVVDDRPAFTNPSLYPDGVRTICGDIPKSVADFPITASTYVVIVTRGHRHDGVVLRACIDSPAAYLGMIGSKRKAHMIRKGFLADGIASAETFDRVYTPVGLDIGALTVEEIAVSIAAQLIAVRRKRAGVAASLAAFVKP